MRHLLFVFLTVLTAVAQTLLLDTNFPAGAGPNDFVRSIDVRPDGRIPVAGNFEAFNGREVPPLVQLLPDGSLDPDFNAGPFFGSSSPRMTRVRIAPDGRIIAQGSFTNVGGLSWIDAAVLMPNGSPDTNFSFPAMSPITASISSFIPANDGGFWISGTFTNLSGRMTPRIAKLHANGSVDPAFQSPFGPAESVGVTLVPLPDGRLVIYGTFTNITGVAVPRIARLHADGTLDPSFRPEVPGTRQINRLMLMPDGSLVGTISGHPLLDLPGELIRFHPDGQVDRSFRPAFTFSGTLSGTYNRVLALMPEPDGSVLIAGNFLEVNGLPRNGLARILSDGSVAACFDPGIGPNLFTIALARQPNGQVLIGGVFRSVEGQDRPYFARLASHSDCGPGTFAFAAPEFLANESSPTALVTILREGSAARVESARLETIDDTARAGEGYEGSVFEISFERGERARTISIPLRSDAVIEADETVRLRLLFSSGGKTNEALANLRIIETASFRSAGLVDPEFQPEIDLPVTAAALANDGDLILGVTLTNVAGYAWYNEGSLRRLAGDGSRRAAFRTNLFDGEVAVIASLPNGSFLAGGFFRDVNQSLRPALARFDSGGNLDRSFNPFVDHASTNTFRGPEIYAITVLPDGTIICAGKLPEQPTSYMGYRLFKIKPDGTLDRAFLEGQELQSGAASALAQLADGSFITAYPGESIVLGRVLPSGLRAARFIPPAYLPPAAEALAILPDQSILAGGTFYFGLGESQPALARVAHNGGAILPFSVNASTSIDLHESSFARVVAASDGRIVVAGNIVLGGNPARMTVLRLHADGSWDPSFDTGAGAIPREVRHLADSYKIEPRIRVLIPRPDKSWLVGGDFAGFNNVTRPFLVRLIDGPANAASTARFTAERWEIPESGGELWVNVARQGSAESNLTARFVTSPRTAVPGTHFLPVDQLLNFAPGEWLKRVPIQIVSNDLAELDRTFEIELRPDNASGAPLSSGIVTIKDDDVNVEFLADQFGAAEGEPFARIGLRAIGAVTTNIVVELIVRDLVPTNILIQIPAVGQQRTTNYVSVPVLDDESYLPGQTSSLRLNVLSHAASLGPRSTATLHIQENDFPNSPGRGVAGIVNVVKPAPDGGVYLAGDFTAVHGQQRARVARLLPDGLVDPAFDPRGGPDGQVRALAVQTDGRVLISGDFFTVNGHARPHVARLLPGGDVDLSFNAGSGAAAGTGAEDYTARVFALLPNDDGSVFVGGRFASFQGRAVHSLVRLRSDGTFDPDFRSPLSTYFTWPDRYHLGGSPPTVREIHPVPGGGLLLVGDMYVLTRTPRNDSLLALFPNGDLDTNFTRYSASQPVATAAPAPGGGWYIGTASPRNGWPRPRPLDTNWVAIRRLTTNGQPDLSFSVRGLPKIGASYSAVRVIQSDPAGRILFVAEITDSSGYGETILARLLPDGTWDESFHWLSATSISSLAFAPKFDFNDRSPTEPELESSESIKSFALQPDGVLVLGGAFNEIDGEPRRRLARLDSTGTLRGRLALILDASVPGLLRVGAQPEIEIPYAIESSADLITWETVRLNRTPWIPAAITLESAASLPYEYFRAVPLSFP